MNKVRWRFSAARYDHIETISLRGRRYSSIMSGPVMSVEPLVWSCRTKRAHDSRYPNLCDSQMKHTLGVSCVSLAILEQRTQHCRPTHQRDDRLDIFHFVFTFGTLKPPQSTPKRRLISYPEVEGLAFVRVLARSHSILYFSFRVSYFNSTLIHNKAWFTNLLIG